MSDLSNGVYIEKRVAQFACYIGLLRVLYSIVQDVLNQREPIVLGVSITIFLSIAVMYLLISSNRYTHLGIVLLSFVISLALGVNWLMFGGINGKESYNFLLWLAIVMVMNRWRERVFFGVFAIGLIVVLMLVTFYYPDYFQFIYLRDSVGNASYFFSLGGAFAVVYYLKVSLNMESEKLITKKGQVHSKIEELESHSHQLEQERMALKQLQLELEAKVKARTNEVGLKNNAIKDYLELNLVGLKTPIESIHDRIIALNDKYENDDLYKLLSASSEELLEVTHDIKRNLTDGGKIKRELIKGN